MSTIEEVITEINQAGFSVNNIMQLDDVWQVNLRDDKDMMPLKHHRGTGLAKTLKECLELSKVENEKLQEHIRKSQEAKAKPATAADFY